MLRISSLARIFTRQALTREVPVNYSAVSRILLQVRHYPRSVRNYEEPKATKELIAAQDSDTFGSLNVNVEPAEDVLVDEGDIQEEKFQKLPPKRSQKLSTKQYGKRSPI